MKIFKTFLFIFLVQTYLMPVAFGTPPQISTVNSITNAPDELILNLGNALLVSETEFERLLSSQFLAADLPPRIVAMETVKKMNAPVAVGIVADFSAGAAISPLGKQIFIVARNPRLYEPGNTVETTDYYLATVQFSVPFQGWVGTNPVLKLSGRTSPGIISAGGIFATCCEGEDNKCYDPVVPGAGPGVCPPDTQCTNGFDGDADPGSPKYVTGNAVGLYHYPNAADLPTGSWPFPVDPVEGRVCEECLVAFCLPPDIDPADSPENPEGGACGINDDTPEFCHYLTPGSGFPPQCDIRFYDYSELNTCTGLGSPGGLVSTHSQSSPSNRLTEFPECAGDELPEFCKYAIPDGNSNLCDPTQNEAQQAFLDIMGCGGSGSVTVGAGLECCEGKENCGCTTKSNGERICYSCNTDGICQSQTSKSPIDPRLIDSDDGGDGEGEQAVPCGSVGVDCVGDECACGDPVPKLKKQGKTPEQIATEEAAAKNLTAKQNEEDKKKKNQQNNTPSFKPIDCLQNPGHAVCKTRNKNEVMGSSEGIDEVASDPEQEAQAGDPVSMGNGALLVNITDLSFEGVNGSSLSFSRSYDSRSSERGVLGSNWTHNWEVRLEPLKPKTAPSWASNYCKTWYPFATCLMFHDGFGNQSLFIWDPADEMYKPQAGQFNHIRAMVNGGYLMRSPEGEEKRFDQYGYLVRVNDRFGNAKTIQYEATPAFLLYRRYCYREENEGPTTGLDRTFDPRLCEILSHMFGDQPKNDLQKEGWVSLDPVPSIDTIGLPLEDWQTVAPKSFEGLDGVLSIGDYRLRLMQARVYVQEVLRTGYFPKLPTGSIRFRPIKVMDNLGRELNFEYETGVTNPDFGLLKSVKGPTNVVVEFAYDRPSTMGIHGFPKRLNESFLVQARRKHDTAFQLGIDNSGWIDKEQQGDYRTFDYTYQWPQVFGSSVPAWENFHESVKKKWANYFGVFLGCDEANLITCPGGGNMQRGGNPCLEAEWKRQEYMSSIADNIISIDRNSNLEVFSDYDPDPDGEFDRVTLQRWGADTSTSGNAYERSIGQPSFDFEYLSAGPIFGSIGDNTDSLPSEIKQRYPLEVDNSVAKADAVDCATPNNPYCFNRDPAITPSTELGSEVECGDILDQPTRRECNPEEIGIRESDLPGFRPTLNYFYAPEVFVDTKEHSRSRLTCNQLAIAALADPFHNDLLSTMEPIVGTTTNKNDHQPVLITGHRLNVARDANRICGWTKTTSRDNEVTYHGMNFRSQILVTATKISANTFLYEDAFYNADGNPIEVHQPERGTVQQIINGKTVYLYEEINGDDDGGWNKFLPAFWGKRSNLIEILEIPKFVVYESDIDGYSNAHSTYFTYEPLYNQLRTITKSKHHMTGGESLLYRVKNQFDYQEFAAMPSNAITPDAVNNPLAAVLYSQISSGFNWAFDGSGSSGKIDNAHQMIEYQFSTAQEGLPSTRIAMPFYNRDLNGDGDIGFSDGPNGKTAKAVPVRIILEDLQNSTSEKRFTYISWASNGSPAEILQPNGKRTSYFYYPSKTETNGFDDMFGVSTEPQGTAISQNYSGLLAKVSWNEYDFSYPTTHGPASTLCEAFRGPYQWMIPDCQSAPIEPQLFGLNIPQTTIEDILRSQTNPQKSLSISYNETGTPYFVWENGRKSIVKHDSDGRTVKHTDVKGNVTEIEYTLNAQVEEETITSVYGGSPIYSVKRKFDNEDRLLAECTALESGGCDNFLNNPLPATGDPSPTGSQIVQYEYSDGGLLQRFQDPEGTLSAYVYDSRRRLVEEFTIDTQASSQPRRVAYAYDDLNRTTEIEYGTAQTQSQVGRLFEAYAYDEYDRVISKKDIRGTLWQAAYSQKNELLRLRQSDVPYAPGDNQTPEQFVEYRYNGHSELISQNQSGIMFSTWDRLPDGRVASETSTGRGTTYMSFDTDGNVVWQQSPHFDSAISVMNPGSGTQTPRMSTVGIMRKIDGKDYGQGTSAFLSSEFLTITRLVNMNMSFEVTDELSTGNDGITQTSSWQTGPLGYVTAFTNPEGAFTAFSHNLVGWTTETHVEKSSGGYQTTLMEYNARGQQKKLTDPSGQISQSFFNGFGDSVRSNRPNSNFHSLSEYDGLGRISRQRMASGELIQFNYDTQTGDGISQVWLNSPNGARPMLEQEFDILGRVIKATNHNVGLENIGAMPLSRIVNQYTYDALGRVTQDIRKTGGETMSIGYNYAVGDLGWEKTTTYPTGDTSIEATDLSGRILHTTTTKHGVSRLHDHVYMGGINMGRTHTWETSGFADPMVFDSKLDGFGRKTQWSVNPLEFVNPDINFTKKKPVNVRWADYYCKGYDVQRCGNPILKIDAIRDVMGRIRSVNTRFSHPMRDSTGLLEDGHHYDRWRGYEYEKRGYLNRVWERDREGYDPTDTSSLIPNVISNSILANVAEPQGSDPWGRLRDDDVGSLNKIENYQTGEVQWEATSRNSGHQLAELAIDGDGFTIQHDDLGRTLNTIGKWSGEQGVPLELRYDPASRLIGVFRGNDPVELYAYDASGNLAYVFNPDSGEGETFAFDGNRMIVSLADDSSVNWVTFFGPQQDQILEYYDTNQNLIPIQDNRNSIVGAWDMDNYQMLTEMAFYNAEGRATLLANEKPICEEVGNFGVNCGAPGGIPFAFNGRWRSKVTGFVNMTHRWYSPRMGEFITHDPMGYIDLFNLYGFASYDSINYWDPYGLEDSFIGTLWKDGQKGAAFLSGKIKSGAGYVGQAQMSYANMVAGGLDKLGLDNVAQAARYSGALTATSIEAGLGTVAQLTVGAGPNILLLFDSAGTDLGEGTAKLVMADNNEERLLGGAQLAGGLGQSILLLLPSAAYATKLKPRTPNANAEVLRTGNPPRIRKTKSDSKGNEIIRQPSSLQDQMVLDAAKRGEGQVIMKSLKDKRFKDWEKWEVRLSSDGGKVSNVHYVKDPILGVRADFKFKARSTDFGYNKNGYKGHVQVTAGGPTTRAYKGAKFKLSGGAGGTAIFTESSSEK